MGSDGERGLSADQAPRFQTFWLSRPQLPMLAENGERGAPGARSSIADSAASAGEFSWPGRMAPPGAKQSRDPMQGEMNKAADNTAECHLCNTSRETAPAGDE